MGRKSADRLILRALLVALLIALGVGLTRSEGTFAAQRGGSVSAPQFQVTTLWPKPLPNHWILGSVTGVAVDEQDHVWIVHRGLGSLTARTEAGIGTDPPTAEVCCAPAPQVLEFDSAGALVSHWGGPGQGYDWPLSPSGIAFDAKGNIWIAGAGAPAAPATARGTGSGQAAAKATAPAAPPPPPDGHVLKFTRAGKFLLQIGKPGKGEGSDSKTMLSRPAAVEVDPSANELYVADGYGNRRVVVFDSETGAYKRHWGAYGEKPDDGMSSAYDPNAPPARHFRTVSCVRIAKDGLVYVCDRQNDRLQVFQKDGKFVKEAFFEKGTRGDGSVWDVAFSRDPQQRFLFLADGQNQKIVIVRRDTLEVVGEFGDGGRIPGRFYGVGSIVVDSKGTIYTGESLEGKRIQKFTAR